MPFADLIRNLARKYLRFIAVLLNKLSGGRLHPNIVTITGVLMHVPIALLIASRSHNDLAAVLLVIFGLFDVIDGELARLQNRASPSGMLLDASTDRFKETMLYMGTAYVFAAGSSPKMAVWAVAACGASICVSYIKTKGEAAIATASQPIDHAKLNRLFKDGLLTFEFRMALLVLGLIINQLLAVTVIIAILATFTALQRLIRVSRAL